MQKKILVNLKNYLSETIQYETHRKRQKTQNTSEPWDTFKRPHLYTVAVAEGETVTCAWKCSMVEQVDDPVALWP